MPDFPDESVTVTVYLPTVIPDGTTKDVPLKMP